MTIQELQKNYLPSIAPEDFFILLAEATGRNKAFLLAHPEYEPSQEETTLFEGFLRRRKLEEPVAYITGHKEFYGREFLVSKDTLIPRPETEILVEEVMHYVSDTLPPLTSLDIIDVGTGSGNIIITLAHEIGRGGTRFFGVDISSSALEMAKQNASHFENAAPIEFFESDLLHMFTPYAHDAEHLIIAANLPYLSQEIYAATEKNVREFEPESALVSGEKGLDHYYRLLDELKTISRSPHTTTIFFEISPEQASILPSYIRQHFPASEIDVVADLSGKERIIKARI